MICRVFSYNYMNPPLHGGKVTLPRYGEDPHQPLWGIVLAVNSSRAYIVPGMEITWDLGSYLIYDSSNFRYRICLLSPVSTTSH